MTVELLADDVHDQGLVAHVRPPGWINPTPARRYHLVVLGAGPAGLVAAVGAAGLGARVALVERDLLGGDCLNTGCVPSKALLRSARAAAAVRDAGAFGVRVPTGTTVDFPAVMARVRRLRAGLAEHDAATRFAGLGIDVFLGEGRFTGTDTVGVGAMSLRFRRAVIATGARAARPEVPGLDTVGFLTNESVFALTELPRRLAVIGAGPVGCELAQAFARLGSRVTLIGREARVLPRDDPEAAALVEAALTRDGVTLHLGTEPRWAEPHAEGKALFLAGQAEPVVADAILAAAGRRPNIEGLNLDAAGLGSDPKTGVIVDDRLRTANPRVFAAGDVCSRWQFTHAADAAARVVLANALFPFGRGRASVLTIPRCTYTDPELAQIGLTAAEAAERGVRHRVFVQPFAALDRAVVDDESEGFVKIVAAPNGRILGATVVASDAGDLAGELAVVMAAGLRLGRLAGVIHPYPTRAEAIRKLGDAYNRTRLTPLVKRLFGWWFRMTR